MSTVVAKKIVKFICVGVDIKKTGQSNKFYNMTENGDGTFTVEYGRVGEAHTTTKTYPIKDWDKKYKEKLRNEYTDVTELAEVKEVSVIKSNAQTEADKVLTLLQSFAKGSISKEYLVSSTQVTQKQVDKAQSIIDSLASLLKEKKITQKDVNDLFLDLYKTIPRKMEDVRSHILKVTPSISETDVKWALKKNSEEQELLDRMAGQVLLKESSGAQKGLADSLGVQLDLVTDNTVIERIKQLMGDDKNRLVRLWSVNNEKTFKKLLIWPDTKEEEFFHGSRNENWFNIVQSGLMIKPAGVHHTGSMFGNGVYFADKAKKSIGYTSINNSYFARGTSNTAFLAVYAVKLGRSMEVKKHTSECYNFNKDVINKKGYDSVFALKGADLVNNEYIAYDPAQSSIKYLIEFK